MFGTNLICKFLKLSGERKKNRGGNHVKNAVNYRYHKGSNVHINKRPIKHGAKQAERNKANHGADTDPVIYAIEQGGKALLYANDTGMLSEESLDYIASLGIRFDFVSLDCTAMFLKDWRDGHMGLDTNAEFLADLKRIGAVDEQTTVYVNHFSHNGLATHEELVTEAAKLGWGVTYDGIEVEF